VTKKGTFEPDMKNIRIAAAIVDSPVGQIRNNLNRAAELVAEAHRRDAAIICFPELNISGYSTQADIKQAAEPIPGEVSRHLLKLAGDYQICVLAGCVEGDAGGKIFASHIVALPDKILGVYRKIHIAPPERKVFSAGNSVPLFDLSGMKAGIQLCYDVHFPELSTRMAVDGADVIFMPHASPRGTPAEKFKSWMRHLTARAFDNGLFIVACNQSGENRKGLKFPGVAVIIGPDGEVVDKKADNKEGLLIANLKAQDLAKVRNHRMRYFLPNRRPEVYIPRKKF
jgi:N-carbamoylputrescine amidase